MGVVRNLFDGLTNALTGAGSATDPRSYNHYFSRTMTDSGIDAAYRGSWVMRKIIDKPATEMVREWRDWQADSADIEALEAEEKRLDIRNKVRRAEVLRGLGGAGMVLWTADADQSSPMVPASIQQGGLKQIHVWHRSRFTLGPVIEDWADPWFGHPSYYQVKLTGTRGPSDVKFHPSRVVAFKADQVADIATASWQDCFWGQSKVQTVLEAVQNVDTAENGFAALIKDARNRRLYVSKLMEKVATGDKEALFARRAQALAAGESSLGVTFLDGGNEEGKGGEKLEDRQMVWAGIPEIKASYWTASAAAADMPGTVLWGTSPQGMNATGASDIELWHKTIAGRQDLDLRPCMTQVDAALIPSALGHVDDGIWYEWAPLSTQTEKDEATTFWNFMQGLQILVGTGAVPEIAIEKSVQNLLEERGWLPGISDALGELSEEERFPSKSAPDAANSNEPDPSALQGGGDPISAGGGGDGSALRRRAANDALKAIGLSDAQASAALAIMEVGDEPSRPFDDAYNAGQPRDRHGRWIGTGGRARASIGDLVAGRGKQKPIGMIGEEAAALIGALGHDVRGKPVTLDPSYTRHIHLGHGGGREVSRGQERITKRDLLSAHRILSGAHKVTPGGGVGVAGHPRFVATTHAGAMTHTIVGEVRKRRVVVVSMWKVKE